MMVGRDSDNEKKGEYFLSGPGGGSLYCQPRDCLQNGNPEIGNSAVLVDCPNFRFRW